MNFSQVLTIPLRATGLIALLILSAPPLAFAKGGGGMDTGGGDALICTEKNWTGIFDRKKVYLADTYAFFQSEDKNRLAPFRKLSEPEIIQAILHAVRDFDAELGDTLADNLGRLHFVPVASVEELDDDNLQDLPRNCRKKQLAIQEPGGLVRYDQKLFASLSRLEQALFKLHESYIRARTPSEAAQHDTTAVRARVAEFARSRPFAKFLARIDVARNFRLETTHGRPRSWPAFLIQLEDKILAAVRAENYSEFLELISPVKLTSSSVRIGGEEHTIREGKTGLNLDTFYLLREAFRDVRTFTDFDQELDLYEQRTPNGCWRAYSMTLRDPNLRARFDFRCHAIQFGCGGPGLDHHTNQTSNWVCRIDRIELK